MLFSTNSQLAQALRRHIKREGLERAGRKPMHSLRSTGITTLAVFLHIFEFSALPWLKMTSVYIATFLLAVSMVQYLQKFITSIRIGRAQ